MRLHTEKTEALCGLPFSYILVALDSQDEPLPQLAVIAVDTAHKDDDADDVKHGGYGKAVRQTDGLLHEAHEQRAYAYAYVIGEHVGRVCHAALRAGRRAGDEGLEERLQDAVAQSEEETGDEQMQPGLEEEEAQHREYQHHYAGKDQRLVLAGVNDLLGRELGDEHSGDEADVEIGQPGHDVLLLRQDGGVGDDRAVGYHQEHHVQHEGQRGLVDALLQ